MDLDESARLVSQHTQGGQETEAFKAPDVWNVRVFTSSAGSLCCGAHVRSDAVSMCTFKSSASKSKEGDMSKPHLELSDFQADQF